MWFECLLVFILLKCKKTLEFYTSWTYKLYEQLKYLTVSWRGLVSSGCKMPCEPKKIVWYFWIIPYDVYVKHYLEKTFF